MYRLDAPHGNFDMKQEIYKYYFDKLCERNFIFFKCENGSQYLLSRSMCSHIPELPPGARAYPIKRQSQEWNTWGTKWISFLRRYFGREDETRIPSPEHYALLQVGFQSAADTVYFMANGAVIHFFLKEDREKIRFYTGKQAEEKGILIQDYRHNSSYKKVPVYEEGKEGLYPIEGGYIVKPGFCISGELCDMSAFQMNPIENALSIDFVQGSFSFAEYPEESRAFRELPSLFSELSGSAFDFQVWERAMKANSILPEHNCVHPFYQDGVCVAELVIVNLIWGTSYYPYHDSYVLLLRYSPVVESCVIQLVDLVSEKHPGIKLVGIEEVVDE